MEKFPKCQIKKQVIAFFDTLTHLKAFEMVLWKCLYTCTIPISMCIYAKGYCNSSQYSVQSFISPEYPLVENKKIATQQFHTKFLL